MELSYRPRSKELHLEHDRVGMGASRDDITALVRRWSDGDAGAFDRLIEVAYEDLRRIAHHHLDLGARSGTVDTTALVHEAPDQD